MNRIKQLRTALGYTQAKLASVLNVSRTTVTMWETGQREPDYATLAKLADIFNISSDYIIGAGVFENWDEILKYYDAVAWELIRTIPPDLEMPFFNNEKYLNGWLDTRLYKSIDEIQLARWFFFAVKSIKITPIPMLSDGQLDAEVKIEFTQEFQYIIDGHSSDKPHTNEIPPVSNSDTGGISDALAKASTETKIAMDILSQLNSDYLDKAIDNLQYLIARQRESEGKQ